MSKASQEKRLGMNARLPKLKSMRKSKMVPLSHSKRKLNINIPRGSSFISFKSDLSDESENDNLGPIKVIPTREPKSSTSPSKK